MSQSENGVKSLLLWREFHGERDPIGYLLRADSTKFWLRIHSLPGSKRYAKNEAETREILRRYNAAANEVLGQDAHCLLFLARYADEKFPALFAGFEAEKFADYREPEISLWAAKVRWQSGSFDEILRRVADDEVHYVSWMNAATGEIFAPYDGGADLFLNAEARRDQLAARFSGWLPRHPQGL